jgi:RNA polymerase sigma-70 factor, ECF subfamily
MNTRQRLASPATCPGLSCRNRIMQWAFRHVEDPEDAEDIAGEVCLHCRRGMARFRGEAEFATWLYRVTRNVLIDHLRTRHHQREVLETALGQAAYEGALLSAAAPAEETQHEIESIRTALCRLTPRQRHLIEWKYGDGLTYAEISSRLRISEAAASQALYRAREALRKALSPDVGDDL